MTQRTQMMLEHLEGGYSIAALARRHGVSRKTAYKWLERFARQQWAGLEDRSRAPHVQAMAVSEGIEARVLALKKQWPLWGAPKLHHKLLALVGEQRCPCESTVSNILHRHGLTKAPRARRHHVVRAAMNYGQEPNHTWCADFKGWWRTGDGRRCDPLTITDASSRYLIRCQALGKSTATSLVRPVFIAAFREFGMPVAIRTDNGPPFASNGLGGLSQLSVWWLKQGIRLDRIEPGHPEQNGRHERMHRTLKQAVGTPARHLRAQQTVLDRFRQQYNEERPHEALDFAVPASRYEPSPRPWSEKRPGPMEYEEGWQRRLVEGSGQIKWRGNKIHVTRALSGEHIGLKPVAEGEWEAFFGPLSLGILNERKQRLQAPRQKQPGRTAAGSSPLNGCSSSLRCDEQPLSGDPA